MKQFNLVVTNKALNYLTYLKIKNINNINTINFRIALKKEDLNVIVKNIIFIYCFPGEEFSTDKKFIIMENITIFVAQELIEQIINIKIDYNDFNKKLIIKIPYVKKLNTKLKKLEKFIEQNINPLLSKHDGYIKPFKLEKNSILYIKFYGTCSSCTLTKFTLDNVIKKLILHNFTYIKNIIKI